MKPAVAASGDNALHEGVGAEHLAESYEVPLEAPRHRVRLMGVDLPGVRCLSWNRTASLLGGNDRLVPQPRKGGRSEPEVHSAKEGRLSRQEPLERG